mmetsp:Transcript_64748/g.181004  ORF Transcript_64748/g.181004 Transcript_64748/m.181004 type:complete len:279 (-) Transcript_64748:858-1694(-)
MWSAFVAGARHTGQLAPWRWPLRRISVLQASQTHRCPQGMKAWLLGLAMHTTQQRSSSSSAGAGAPSECRRAIGGPPGSPSLGCAMGSTEGRGGKCWRSSAPALPWLPAACWAPPRQRAHRSARWSSSGGGAECAPVRAAWPAAGSCREWGAKASARALGAPPTSGDVDSCCAARGCGMPPVSACIGVECGRRPTAPAPGKPSVCRAALGGVAGPPPPWPCAPEVCVLPGAPLPTPWPPGRPGIGASLEYTGIAWPLRLGEGARIIGGADVYWSCEGR